MRRTSQAVKHEIGHGLRRFACIVVVAAAVVCAAGSCRPAHAQAPLSAVNGETTVSKISFKFVDDTPFRENALKDQLWHSEPGFWDRVTRVLPVVEPPPFPFNPIELQRDVVRLERYHQRNGFLHPSIDYPASQFDSADNKIHIIFTIRKGPPLIIQDIGFYSGDDTYTAEALTGPMRDAWIEYRDALALETGGRYTEFEGIRIQDAVLAWLQNRGYAFAEVTRETRIDSTANTVDLRFNVDAGPRGTVSEIQIEGNESVDRSVVLRALPFGVGDRFSARRLEEGQRELFRLNLFRVAIAEVPDQPRDSTVVVRYRLSEARARRLTAQTGYALDQGALAQGSWTHRNFFGGARQFTASTTFSSGYGATGAGGFGAAEQKSVSLSLTQPYIFMRKLSGVISPSYIRGQEPGLDLRFEEAEISTSLLYTIYNFRTITFSHTLARARPLEATHDVYLSRLDSAAFDEPRTVDIFNRNIFSLTANLGNVDDYLQPSAGFLIRPRIEMGGILVQLPDDVDYLKAQTEIVGYYPLTEDYNLGGRLFVGKIWPRGESLDQLERQIEYRFDRIRFYAGGSNDVRGWPLNLLGPKLPVIARSDEFDPVLGDSIEVTRLEPAGGLAKFAANLELRTPMPFAGPSWKGAVFLDAGQVFPTDEQEAAFRLRDVSFADLRFGAGAGLRYETLVGYVRFDLGYKINPSIEELASPRELYMVRRGIMDRSEVETSFLDRFRFHLSIGQTF